MWERDNSTEKTAIFAELITATHSIQVELSKQQTIPPKTIHFMRFFSRRLAEIDAISSAGAKMEVRNIKIEMTWV